MRTSRENWVLVGRYESNPEAPPPKEALRAWLSERGLERMPFADDDARIRVGCGRGQQGGAQAWWLIEVAGKALMAAGIDPEAVIVAD